MATVRPLRVAAQRHVARCQADERAVVQGAKLAKGSLTAYIVRRALLMIPMLVGISLVSFAIIRLAPGDPERLLIDPQYVTFEQLASVRQELGLDDPLPIQYLK